MNDDELFERRVEPEITYVVFHYTHESGAHYWKELDRSMTVEEMKVVLSGDLVFANGLLNDRIATVETLELTREQIDAIPHEHPEWERWLGERWKVVPAEDEEASG